MCHKTAYLRKSVLLHSKCLKTERQPESIFYVYQKRISEERNWSGHIYSTTQTTLSYLIPAGVYIKWPLTQTKAGMLLGNRVKRRLEWWRWERGWEKIKLHKFTGRSQNAKERKLKVKKLSLFFLGFWFFRFLNRNFVKFSELLLFAFHVILPLYLVSKDFYATISKFLTLHITCVVHSKECYLVFTKSLIVEIDRFRALKEINLILFGGVRHHNTKLNPSVCGILSVSYYFNLCVKK